MWKEHGLGGEGLQETIISLGAVKSWKDCGWVEWSKVHQILLLNAVSDSYRIWISTNTSEPGDSLQFGCCECWEVLCPANSDSQRMSKAQQEQWKPAKATAVCVLSVSQDCRDTPSTSPPHFPSKFVQTPGHNQHPLNAQVIFYQDTASGLGQNCFWGAKIKKYQQYCGSW